jgi:SAM-dependent methyltransferase
VSALDHWREQLEGWAIPEEIRARAPEDPWGFPVELFAAKADAPPADSPSRIRALEVLSAGGSVLDVGCGPGAASLALVPPAATLTGVDPLKESLREFEARASLRGVSFEAVPGSWPGAAPSVEAAEVVVCHHVLYNVPDLGPFVDALTGHANRRVVVELTERHPSAWTADLWRRFHGLPRPSGPTADECARALHELGVDAFFEVFDEPAARWGFRRKEDAVAMVRRRLCLPRERDTEVEEAIGNRIQEVDGFWRFGRPPRRLATLWWDA